ncbi:hypothetical protein Rs2_51422 [Raphanus sativus]|nr:hypothetical protein Rs2_51422 [Raphanus sativus]
MSVYPCSILILISNFVGIIGEISAVKRTVSQPPEDKNRVMVTVKLENDVSVTLSLFNCQAVSFHKRLEGMLDDPKVRLTVFKAEEGINPEDSKMSPFIADMEGKTYTFQIRVTWYNFTVNHQSLNGGEGGDDDTPDVPKGHGKIASGKGVCEASKNAGKEPVRNSHKKAHVA